MGLNGSNKKDVAVSYCSEPAYYWQAYPVSLSHQRQLITIRQIRTNLERRGLLKKDNDIWIAAVALELGAVLVTNDSDFQDMREIERRRLDRHKSH